MAVGSDSGHAFNPQSTIAVELEPMVRYGFSEMEAIMVVTAIGAKVIGRDDELGTLAAGRFAHLLMLDRDPLSVIAILQDAARLERMYQGGRLVAGSLAPRRDELELSYFLASDQGQSDGPSGAHVKSCCPRPSEES